MRLTKLEKQVDQLIADGYDPSAIAAVLKITASGLMQAMEAIKGKRSTDELKEARRKDIIVRNSLVAPKLGTLECKNLDRENPSYWLFEGDELRCAEELGALLQLGIPAKMKQNGNTGSFLLIVPVWVTGRLQHGAEATWQETIGNPHLTDKHEGENYVNNSITTTAEARNTSADCYESGFEYIGEFQGKDIECFA